MSARRWWPRPRLLWPPLPVLLETAAVAVGLASFLSLGRLYSVAVLVSFDQGGLALARSIRGPLLDAVAQHLTLLGADLLWLVWMPIVGLLLLRRKLAAALALVVVAGGVGVWNDLLKGLYHRARPLEFGSGVQAFSFPSGHAMAAGAVFGLLAFLSWRELRGRRRIAAIAGAVTLAILIALTRPYLGVHYPSDVVAGLLAGLLWADLVVLVWRLATHARLRRVPPPPTRMPAAERSGRV